PSYFLILRFFFFIDSAPTQIYTLSLHDALPIYPTSHPRGRPAGLRHRAGHRRRQRGAGGRAGQSAPGRAAAVCGAASRGNPARRSEEHTSELQSRRDLVCRLLLEKKKKKNENAA